MSRRHCWIKPHERRGLDHFVEAFKNVWVDEESGLAYVGSEATGEDVRKAAIKHCRALITGTVSRTDMGKYVITAIPDVPVYPVRGLHLVVVRLVDRPPGNDHTQTSFK